MGVSARQEPQQEVDVIGLMLRRIAIAPHPLTLADVRKADDGAATLDPHETATRLRECCDTGLLEGVYDPYPKCIMTKGRCPPQTVYTITTAGMDALAEHANHN